MISYILAVIIGIVIGFGYAHHVVATECRLLGRFYVGKTVFECTVIKDTQP